jgi:hypothetical protein
MCLARCLHGACAKHRTCKLGYDVRTWGESKSESEPHTQTSDTIVVSHFGLPWAGMDPSLDFSDFKID